MQSVALFELIMCKNVGPVTSFRTVQKLPFSFLGQLLPRIIFNATIWSLSIASVWACVMLSCHTTERYSREDRTCNEYICNNFVLDRPAYFNFVSIDMLAYALFMIGFVLISQQLGSSSIQTPRILVAVSMSIKQPSSVNLLAKTSLFLVCNVYLDLSEFSFMRFCWVQTDMPRDKIGFWWQTVAGSVGQCQCQKRHGLGNCNQSARRSR